MIKSELSEYPEVEVNTVDQYQGLDKQLIIISFTRSFQSAADSENKAFFIS